MNAKYFFQNVIKDNNFQGYDLNALELNNDFYCSTHGKWKSNINSIRKKGVQDFVREVYDLIASKNLSELDISLITFDEEFEANQEQRIFNISGDNFDNFRIYSENIVGSIIYKSNYFNINCRFGNEFLRYMIANTSGFLEFENVGAIDIDGKQGLGEWILTYYWKLLLKKTFSLGLYKTYQKKKANLTSVRGIIDINSLLKKNYFDGKTVCCYKEHSYKNELNSVISMALTKVFKSKFQPIVSDIYNIKNAFDSINTSNLPIRSIRSQKVINPYFKKYNQVFDLSLKILKNEFANIGESDSEFSAFLFDISLLFEHHIRKILMQKFVLLPKNKQEFNIPNGIYRNDIFPDVIIDHGNNKIGIYEVKYKNFIFNGKNQGVDRNDKFQLITYVAIHLAKYKVVECGFIYPLKEADLEKAKEIKKQMLNIHTQEIPFIIKFYTICDKLENQQYIDRNFFSNENPPIEDSENSIPIPQGAD